MDSAPVVQGVEFPTPQNSSCHHLSTFGPNNPVTPAQMHSGLKEPLKFPIFLGTDPPPKDVVSYN